MEKKKIVSLVLGIVIIVISIEMLFHLKQICYEHSIHQEWSLGAWNAVQISSAIYGIVISVLTLILVLINVIKKSCIIVISTMRRDSSFQSNWATPPATYLFEILE